MGRSKFRRRQLCSPTSASECHPGMCLTFCICRNPCRWIHPYVGRYRRCLRYRSPRSAQCAADSDHIPCSCCHLRLVTWGSQAHGGDSSLVRDQLKNVQQLQATHFSFVAILADGSVVVWGDPVRGGDSTARSAGRFLVALCWESMARLAQKLCQSYWDVRIDVGPLKSQPISTSAVASARSVTLISTFDTTDGLGLLII